MKVAGTGPSGLAKRVRLQNGWACKTGGLAKRVRGASWLNQGDRISVDRIHVDRIHVDRISVDWISVDWISVDWRIKVCDVEYFSKLFDLMIAGRSVMTAKSSTIRRGFTLVELLVVISIIAIITSALAFAVAGAQERARVYRTESQLRRIEAIIQRELLETLEAPLAVRTPPMGNVPYGLGAHVDTINGPTSSNNNFMSQGEGAFLRARRFKNEAKRVALMSRFPYRAELVEYVEPESLARPYIQASGVPFGVPFVGYRANSGVTGVQRFHGMPTNLVAVRGATQVRVIDGDSPKLDSNHKETNSSELLYAVLGRIWVDGEPATSLLRQSEIADTDNDGLKEVVDAWGDPIYFRIQVTMPVTDASGNVGLFNLPIDEMSAWMNSFVVENVATGDRSIYRLEDITPESFNPERVRVVASARNVDGGFDYQNVITPIYP